MSKFVVNMVDDSTDEVLETMDETFDTESEAEDYRQECSDGYVQGAEDMRLRDPFGYDDDMVPGPENVRFEVEEIDD